MQGAEQVFGSERGWNLTGTVSIFDANSTRLMEDKKRKWEINSCDDKKSQAPATYNVDLIQVGSLKKSFSSRWTLKDAMFSLTKFIAV